MRIPKVNIMVTPVSDYDVLISMDHLARLEVVINCQKSSIYFPNYKVRIYCDGKSTQARSAMAKPQEKPQEKPHFPCLCPEDFVKQIPEELPPLCPICNGSTL